MNDLIPSKILHRLGCEAICNAGAVPCEKLLADEDDKKVSDAAFVAEKVIFEVKTFTLDRAKQLAFRERLTKAVEEHLLGSVSHYDPSDVLRGLPDKVADRVTLDLGRRARVYPASFESPGDSQRV